MMAKFINSGSVHVASEYSPLFQFVVSNWLYNYHRLKLVSDTTTLHRHIEVLENHKVNFVLILHSPHPVLYNFELSCEFKLFFNQSPGLSAAKPKPGLSLGNGPGFVSLSPPKPSPSLARISLLARSRDPYINRGVEMVHMQVSCVGNVVMNPLDSLFWLRELFSHNKNSAVWLLKSKSYFHKQKAHTCRSN